MDPSDTRVSAAVGASAIAHCVIGAWASLVAQLAKNLPAIQETWVQSPSREESLKEEMATHSSILAWDIPWTEDPSGLQSRGHKSIEQNLVTKQP